MNELYESLKFILTFLMEHVVILLPIFVFPFCISLIRRILLLDTFGYTTDHEREREETARKRDEAVAEFKRLVELDEPNPEVWEDFWKRNEEHKAYIYEMSGKLW